MGIEKFLFDMGMRFARAFLVVQIACLVLGGIAVLSIVGGTAYYFLR